MSAGRVETQEFYCAHCPPDAEHPAAGGYFIVRLRVGYTRRIRLKCPCPNCMGLHDRVVKDGQILENAADVPREPCDEVFVPLSAWSRTPRARAMAAARERNEKEKVDRHQLPAYRNGVPIQGNRDLIEEAWADRYLDADRGEV